ncbi:hypothetical protein [Pseudomonas defluvii]|uniref:hypothetical protein n=1 Tax=Pseudomonas defluvii TaxID=1876757 RepID=UPI000811A499|nr:hypothetical protein [Pseudomonas defluvii]
MSHAHTLADLGFAQNVQRALVEHLQGSPLTDDTLTIASIGDLAVRIAAADALLAQAGRSSVEAASARLAAAEAAQRASELQVELTGRQTPRPSIEGDAVPLSQLRRRLGDHYLNGVALT